LGDLRPYSVSSEERGKEGMERRVWTTILTKRMKLRRQRWSQRG
jgi:hypothetical protein